MRKNSYIYSHFSKCETNPIVLLHKCRHCHNIDKINILQVTSSHYGTNLGRFKVKCNSCGTAASVCKWQLKSRYLTLSGYVHKANDPADVRKTFDSYVEILQTLTGIDCDTPIEIVYDEADHSADVSVYQAVSQARRTGKSISRY